MDGFLHAVSRRVVMARNWGRLQLHTRVKVARSWLRRDSLERLYCLGDSHCEVFKIIEENNMLSDILIRTTCVSGATAQGAVNPNSVTNALSIFTKILRNVNRSSHLLFMLGEVDCGFVVWYRAKKYNIPVRQQLQNSLSNYFAFLSSVEAMGFRNIIVCTAPLPTIRDGHAGGAVAKLRREVTATLRERTQLTLEYNSQLRTTAIDRGYVIVDIEDDILDPATGVVMDVYRHPDPFNHHLDPGKAAYLYTRELKRYFNGYVGEC